MFVVLREKEGDDFNRVFDVVTNQGDGEVWTLTVWGVAEDAVFLQDGTPARLMFRDKDKLMLTRAALITLSFILIPQLVDFFRHMIVWFSFGGI